MRPAQARGRCRFYRPAPRRKPAPPRPARAEPQPSFPVARDSWRRDQRNRDRRPLAALDRVTQRLQDHGEILARTTHQRRHRDGRNEAVSIRRARRGFAGRGAGPIGDRRTDQIRQSLQNIHPNGTPAANPETCCPVKARADFRFDRDRCPPGLRQMRRSRRCPSDPARRSAAPRAERLECGARASTRPGDRDGTLQTECPPCAERLGRPARGSAHRLRTFDRSSTPNASTI